MTKTFCIGILIIENILQKTKYQNEIQLFIIDNFQVLYDVDDTTGTIAYWHV